MIQVELLTTERGDWTARYSDVLEKLVNELGGKEVLRIDFESGYSGHVDIDVLLEDGKVFTYLYYYGSCSGCDEWEDRDLTGDEIKEVMKNEATFYDNIEQYNDWRSTIK